MRLRYAALPLLAVAAMTVTGCSSSTPSSTPPTVPAATSPAVQGPGAAAPAMIIDVRTPEEFAAGHLDGAVNINLQGPNFNQQIAALGKDGTYEVYCRSGNRSAQAVQSMRNAGFSNVTDRGSVEAASQALGVPVVQ